MNLPYILSVLLLVFGFGFVIFWHELGHFLAAKWVGIKVEQFAVGFGQAILAWRKEKRDVEAIRLDNEKKALEMQKLKIELEGLKTGEKPAKKKTARKPSERGRK